MKHMALAALAICIAEGALAARAAAAQAPSIDDIMARVAANQEKSVAARTQFVYRQEELFALRRSNGSTECQGKREYSVAPGSRGAVRQAVNSESESDGHCSFSFASDSGKSVSLGSDGAGTEGFSGSACWASQKDGIPLRAFPAHREGTASV